MAGFEQLCMNCMEDSAEGVVCPHCGFRKDEPQMRHALPYRTILQGRYIVGKAKKSNGEGVTYIGYDMVLNSKIELREFFPQTLCERLEASAGIRVIGGSEIIFDECLANFLNYSREVAHLRELSAIEQIYDIFEENNTAYTVAEWNESITLRYFIERSGGNLSWNAARQLFMPVLNALSTMHAGGVKHLGISPDSLVILKDGKMKLTDFCIDTVRRMDTDLPPDMVPGCAAIEQYVMDYAPDETTDVYGFAATLFFALTGILPQDALKRRIDSRLLIPTSILKTLPPHVVTALANALQVSPDKRIATFERLRDELSAAPTVTAKIEATQPIRQIPPPYPPEPEEEKRGVPGFVWAIGSCVVALAVFTMIGFFWLSHTQANEPPVESSMAIPEPAVPVQPGESLAESGQASNLQMIDVPDLTGQKYDDIAVTSSNPGNGDYEILLADKQFSDTVAEGYIISQSPEPGGKMQRGSTITIVVSEGAAMRTLPQITDLSLADASAAVTSAGFLPVKEEVYSSTVPAGKMVGYKDGVAGEKLNYGAQVIMLMSKGPDPLASSQEPLE